MRTLRFLLIFSSGLVLLSCLYSRDNAFDPSRCEPSCTDGRVCYVGKCIDVDASIADGAPEDGLKSDSPQDGIIDLGKIDSGRECEHPPVVASCSSGLCTIPAGCFTMGSSVGDDSCRDPDEPSHLVTLTHDFVIMITEVTQSDFQSLMGYQPAAFSDCGPDCPVETVSWHEAVAYCNALSAQNGDASCYTCTDSGAAVDCVEASAYAGANVYNCPGFRLPTEAEWEYAYRAGTSTPLYNGNITSCTGSDTNADKIAWYANNSSGTPHSVNQRDANAWGLHDMAGGVYEWCHDWYHSDLGASAVIDPWGSTPASFRVLRGGSWFRNAEQLRASARHELSPAARSDHAGFRCIKTLLP